MTPIMSPEISVSDDDNEIKEEDEVVVKVPDFARIPRYVMPGKTQEEFGLK